MTSVVKRDVLSKSSLHTNEKKTKVAGKARVGSERITLTTDEKENKTLLKRYTTQGNKDVHNANEKVAASRRTTKVPTPKKNGPSEKKKRLASAKEAKAEDDDVGNTEVGSNLLLMSGGVNKVMEESGTEKMDTSIDVEIPSEKVRERERIGCNVEHVKSKTTTNKRVTSKLEQKHVTTKCDKSSVGQVNNNPSIKSYKIEKTKTVSKTTAIISSAKTKREDTSMSVKGSSTPTDTTTERKGKSVKEEQSSVLMQNKDTSKGTKAKSSTLPVTKNSSSVTKRTTKETYSGNTKDKTPVVNKREKLPGRSATFVKSSSDDQSVASSKSRSTTPMSTSSTSSKASDEGRRKERQAKTNAAKDDKTQVGKRNSVRKIAHTSGSDKIIKTAVNEEKNKGSVNETGASSKKTSTERASASVVIDPRSATPGSTSVSSDGDNNATGSTKMNKSEADSEVRLSKLSKTGVKSADRDAKKTVRCTSVDKNVITKSVANVRHGDVKGDISVNKKESRVHSTSTRSTYQAKHAKTEVVSSLQNKETKTDSISSVSKQSSVRKQTSLTRSRSTTPASMTSSTHSDVGPSMNAKQGCRKQTAGATSVKHSKISNKTGKAGQLAQNRIPKPDQCRIKNTEGKTTRTTPSEPDGFSDLPLNATTDTHSKASEVKKETQLKDINGESSVLKSAHLQQHSKQTCSQNKQLDNMPIPGSTASKVGSGIQRPISRTKEHSGNVSKKLPRQDNKSRVISSTAREITDRLSNLSKVNLKTTTHNEEALSKKTSKTNLQDSLSRTVNKEIGRSNVNTKIRTKATALQNNKQKAVSLKTKSSESDTSAGLIKGREQKTKQETHKIDMDTNKCLVQKHTASTQQNTVPQNQPYTGPERVNISTADSSSDTDALNDQNLNVSMGTDIAPRSLTGYTALIESFGSSADESLMDGRCQLRTDECEMTSAHTSQQVDSAGLGSSIPGSENQPCLLKQDHCYSCDHVYANKSVINSEINSGEIHPRAQHKKEAISQPPLLRSKTYVKKSSVNELERQSNDTGGSQSTLTRCVSGETVTPISSYDLEDKNSSFQTSFPTLSNNKTDLKSKTDSQCSKECQCHEKMSENCSTCSAKLKSQYQENSTLQHRDKVQTCSDSLMDGIPNSESEILRNLPKEDVGYGVRAVDLVYDSTQTSTLPITGADVSHRLTEGQNKTNLSQFTAVLCADTISTHDKSGVSSPIVQADFVNTEQSGKQSDQQCSSEVTPSCNRNLESNETKIVCDLHSCYDANGFLTDTVRSDVARETIKYSEKITSERVEIKKQNRLTAVETDTRNDKEEESDRRLPRLQTVCELNSSTGECIHMQGNKIVLERNMESSKSGLFDRGQCCDENIVSCQSIISIDDKMDVGGENINDNARKSDAQTHVCTCIVQKEQCEYCTRNVDLLMELENTNDSMEGYGYQDETQSCLKVTTDKTINCMLNEQGAKSHAPTRDDLRHAAFNRSGQGAWNMHFTREHSDLPDATRLQEKQIPLKSNQGKPLHYASVCTNEAEECLHLDYPKQQRCSTESDVLPHKASKNYDTVHDKTYSSVFQTQPCDLLSVEESSFIRNIPESTPPIQKIRYNVESRPLSSPVNIQQVNFISQNQSMTEHTGKDELATRLKSDRQNKETISQKSVSSALIKKQDQKNRNAITCISPGNNIPCDEFSHGANSETEQNYLKENSDRNCSKERDTMQHEIPFQQTLLDERIGHEDLVLISRADTDQVLCTQHHSNLAVNQNMFEDKTSSLSTVKITSTQKSSSENSSLHTGEPVARKLVCKKSGGYASCLTLADGGIEINSSHISPVSIDTSFRGILNIHQQQILADESCSTEESRVNLSAYGHSDDDIDPSHESRASEQEKLCLSLRNNQSTEIYTAYCSVSTESKTDSSSDRFLTNPNISGLDDDKQLLRSETDVFIQDQSIQSRHECREHLDGKDSVGVICEQQVLLKPQLDFNSSNCFNNRANLPHNWPGEAVDECDGNILSGITDQSDEKENDKILNKSSVEDKSDGVCHVAETEKRFVKKSTFADRHQRKYSGDEICKASAGREVKIENTHCLFGFNEAQNESSVPLNAGEALCERVSENYDIFEDVYDHFVDAEETFETESNNSQEHQKSVPKPEVSGGSGGLYSFPDVNSSVESFQDAIEDVDNEIRCQRNLSQQSDVTLNDEETLSQISLPSSDLSDDDVTSLENLDLDFCDFCLGDDTTDGHCDMERERTLEHPQDGPVVTCSTHRHVQVRDYRTPSAGKDKAYHGQRNLATTSLFKDRHSSAHINAFKSDMKNEAGQHVIRKFIFKTGNDESTPTPANQVDVFINEDSKNEKYNMPQGHADMIKHEVQSDSKQISVRTKKSGNCDNRVYVSEINRQQNNEQLSKTSSVSRIESDLKRISHNVSKRIAKIETDSTQDTCSKSSVNTKIETAMTIRTERRRRRQEIQNLKTPETSRSRSTGRSCVQSDTENIQKICSMSETQNNKVICESSKIDAENSTLISPISQNLTPVNTGPSWSENKTGENVCISNLHQNEDSSYLLARQPECDVTVAVCSEQLYLTSVDDDISEVQIRRSCEPNETEVNNNDAIVDDNLKHISVDRNENGFKLEINVLNSVCDSRRKPGINEVQKAKSLDMDDIQFIDDDGGAGAADTTVVAADDTLVYDDRTPTPDATFTITYEVSSDDENQEKKCVSDETNSPQNEDELDNVSKEVIVQIRKCATEIQNEVDRKIGNFSAAADSPSSESTVVATPPVKDSDSHSSPDTGDDIKDDARPGTTLEEAETVENIHKVTDIVDISHTNELTSVSLNEDVGEIKPTDAITANKKEDGHDSSDADETQVCEESNISVAKALQMERQKMSLSFNEDVSRADKKVQLLPKRSITADNCTIAHFEKTEESTILSNQLKLSDASQKTNIKKSKSFRLDRENIYPDKDQQSTETAAMMNKRVSDICRSFLNKTRPGVKTQKVTTSPLSPTPQRKLMKWVNAHGKWQRIPIDEETPPMEYDDRTSFDIQESAPDYDAGDSNETLQENEPYITPSISEHNEDNVDRLNNQDDDERAHPAEMIENDIASNTATEVKETSVLPCAVMESSVDLISKGMPKTIDDRSQSLHELHGDISDVTDDVPSQSTIMLNTIDAKAHDLPDLHNSVSDLKDVSDGANVSLLKEDQSDPISVHNCENRESTDSVIDRQSQFYHDIDQQHDISFINTATDVTQKVAEAINQKSSVDINLIDTKENSQHVEGNLEIEQHTKEDVRTNIKPIPELKMQDFLIGFGDHHSRKKDLLRFSKREQSDLNEGHTIEDAEKEDLSEVPKQIPKLKAVKIQEEVFECKPEYMKNSNIQLLESETAGSSIKGNEDVAAPIVHATNSDNATECEDEVEQETWTLTKVCLRKSKTFNGYDNEVCNIETSPVRLSNAFSTSTKSLNIYSGTTPASEASPTKNVTQDDTVIGEKPVKMRSRSRSVETVQRVPQNVGQGAKSRSFKMSNMMGAFTGFRRKNKEKESDKNVLLESSKTSSHGSRSVEDVRGDGKSDKRKLKLPMFMRGDRSKTLPRTKLLSEIVEVEENKDDLSQPTDHQQQQQDKSHDRHGCQATRQVQRSNKRRSLSLPTGSLAFGEARIVYKNGHFTIETMDGMEIDSTRPTDTTNGNQLNQNALNDTYVNGVTPGEQEGEISTMGKGDTAEGIHLQRSHRMKRQYAKTTLNKNDSAEYEDVFGNYECDIENVSPNAQRASMSARHADGTCNEVCSNSSHVSEMSLCSSCSEGMDLDDQEESAAHLPGGSSLQDETPGELKRVAQRARRTSSFKQAQEAGLASGQASDAQSQSDPTVRRRTASLDECQNSELSKSSAAANKSTLFQKMIPKRKTLNENLTTFSKQSDSAKEFFAKKMTLKGLFKKNKSESAVGSPIKTMHPVSPPIAAFQGDDDIGSVDTPPSSPFMHAELRRRHTSADISHYRAPSEANSTDSNSTTPTQERNVIIHRHSVSTPTTPSNETNSFISSVSSSSVSSSKEADQISVSSVSSATSSVQSLQTPAPDQQPHKPKTPKPVGASPRRNPSTGSMSSHLRSHSAQRTKSVTSLESDHSGDGSGMDTDAAACRCECGHKLGQNKPSEDYLEGLQNSLSLCQYCRRLAEYYRTSSGLLNSNVDRIRKHSLVSRQNSDEGASVRDRLSDGDPKTRKDSRTKGSYEKLCIVSQTDVVSSYSNDSGIQRDDSVHSSSDSLKATPEGPVRLRRRKSSSPPPERPRSEVAVRWADLDPEEVDAMVTPVRLRQRDTICRNRPRPKSDFDDNIHLFDELFEEVLEDFVTEGSSFLSDRMRAFGSEVNLQPYCSLRNLYEMRRRDLDKQKNRRMSTPHPIKSRLQRSPRKLQKSTSLVRSNSMPESLDKIHKRRKLNHLLDFHMDTFNNRNTMDMDEYSDDSDLSFDHFSLTEKNGSIRSSQGQLTGMDEIEDNLTYAEALWDHITMDPEELAFRAQDVIEVIDMSDKDWWFGVIDDREGWFPATFVRLRVNQDQLEEDDDLEMTLQADVSTSPKLRRISMFNKNQARTNVVNEIINAEREYVKHLQGVVEGYIVHARKRKEMFPQERIELIFGNLETIYKFAQKFLLQLETCIDEIPHLSEIGQCFLDNVRGFEIYSDYCNNHPSAIEELKELCQDSKYKHFFEACRLLQELAEIPLEGFLLTPVQKICKYQLQLGELLKYTPPDHGDYMFVKDALVAMRKIATLINERKRKMESIEKIAAWQHSVVDWEDEDLLMRSSELIFSGEINKINSAGWSQERYFFLFDHQLIYCKKEFLKRHLFSYKGRIDVDHCEVIDVPDGKDTQYNVTVKNGWKIHEVHKDKWYLLYTKTAAMKERWLKALQDERKRVQEDRDNDFCVPDHWKQSVLNKVRSQSSLKDKQASRGPHGSSLQDFTYSTLPRRVRGQKQDKKKGWSIFGGGKKSKR